MKNLLDKLRKYANFLFRAPFVSRRFQKAFKMDYESYSALAAWKKTQVKKSAGLF